MKKFFLLVMFVFASISGAKTITVDCNGFADYNEISSAIEDANDGDIIIVANGIYTGPANKNLDFDGRQIVLKSINGPAKTVIDCENDGRAFYFHNYETQQSKVVGFTITNGDVNDYHGGAILIEAAGPTIENCIIKNNHTAYAGGAIFYTNDTAVPLEPIIKNCMILQNQSVYSGGGIYSENGDIAIVNCVVAKNISGLFGGGITVLSDYAPGFYDIIDIINSTVADNNDVMGGGGIYIFYNADVLIADSIIYGNNADQIALYDIALEPIVEYCNIQGTYPGPGNIDVDPCFADPDNDDFHLKSTAGRLISVDGAGLVDLLDYAEFAEAWEQGDANNGADLYPDGVIDEKDLMLFVESYLTETASFRLINLQDYSEFAYAWQTGDISSGSDLYPDGIIDGKDLMFFIESYLTEVPIEEQWIFDDVTSRCIDAGNPGAALGNEPSLIHNVRINLGAYGRGAHASATPLDWSLLADINNDGRVDFADFAYLAEFWLQSGYEQFPDFSRNGTVDEFDIVLFSDDWLEETGWH